MNQELKKGKTIQGVVVAAGKMAKTVTVEVRRLVRHPKYGKYQVRRKKYLVHDESGQAKVGDKAIIKEVRPISRRKHFTVLKSEAPSTKSETNPNV